MTAMSELHFDMYVAVSRCTDTVEHRGYQCITGHQTNSEGNGGLITSSQARCRSNVIIITSRRHCMDLGKLGPLHSVTHTET